jgi:hypothetical protein
MVELGLWEILIWLIQVAQIDALVIVNIIPLVRKYSEIIIHNNADTTLPFFNLVRDEKCQRNSFVVFNSWSTELLLDVRFMEHKELLTKNFLFIVDHDPEWLNFSISFIVPIKIWNIDDSNFLLFVKGDIF